MATEYGKSMPAEFGNWMSTGRGDVKSVKYWTLNTTNKLMEKCMNVICMNSKYARIDAINTKNKFVELTLLSVRRGPILEIQVGDSLKKYTLDNDHIPLSLN